MIWVLMSSSLPISLCLTLFQERETDVYMAKVSSLRVHGISSKPLAARTVIWDLRADLIAILSPLLLPPNNSSPSRQSDTTRW